MAEGFYWVQAGCFLGRHQAGYHADDHAGDDAEYRERRCHIQDGRIKQILHNNVSDNGDEVGDAYAQNSAEQTDQEGLGNEDAADIFLPAADRFDDADLCVRSTTLM